MFPRYYMGSDVISRFKYSCVFSQHKYTISISEERNSCDFNYYLFQHSTFQMKLIKQRQKKHKVYIYDSLQILKRLFRIYEKIMSYKTLGFASFIKFKKASSSYLEELFRTILCGNISSRLSSNSEANASELLDNIEEILRIYFLVTYSSYWVMDKYYMDINYTSANG